MSMEFKQRGLHVQPKNIRCLESGMLNIMMNLLSCVWKSVRGHYLVMGELVVTKSSIIHLKNAVSIIFGGRKVVRAEEISQGYR